VLKGIEMADPVTNDENNTDTDTTTSDSVTTTSDTTTVNTVPDDVLEKAISEKLKPIKAQLNNAYSERDRVLGELAEFKERDRKLELERLVDEGKHKEAFDLQIAEEKAKFAALEKRNIELTRDNQVREVLRGLEFRNKRAGDIAFKEIIDELVQNESGTWVHKSGVPISDYVDLFSKDENQSFLFKPKSSSGAGLGSSNSTPNTTTKSKSLFDIPQDELIKMAAEGKL
jgi:hypothetical protein